MNSTPYYVACCSSKLTAAGNSRPGSGRADGQRAGRGRGGTGQHGGDGERHDGGEAATADLLPRLQRHDGAGVGFEQRRGGRGGSHADDDGLPAGWLLPFFLL